MCRVIESVAMNEILDFSDSRLNVPTVLHQNLDSTSKCTRAFKELMLYAAIYILPF